MTLESGRARIFVWRLLVAVAATFMGQSTVFAQDPKASNTEPAAKPAEPVTKAPERPAASEKAAAAPAPAPADIFPYPELLVTPSASERLATEAKAESPKAFQYQAPFLVSGLMTLIAGTMASGDGGTAALKKEAEGGTVLTHYAGLAGMVIGGGWIATATTLGILYKPYQSGHDEVKGLAGNSQRDKLKRERRAEEVLMSSASTYRRLVWLSVLSNAFAGAFMAGTTDGSMAKLAGGLAFGAAFTPLIFTPHWQESADIHEQYKKRIYGPISQVRLKPPIAVGEGPGIEYSLALQF